MIGVNFRFKGRGRIDKEIKRRRNVNIGDYVNGAALGQLKGI